MILGSSPLRKQNSSLSGQTASPSNTEFEAVKARQQNGNATLAAARRGCDVTSTDYVPALLEKGRARAAAEGLDISFQPADAEALPFADTTFDVVLSTFGEMFTPNQNTAASEMLRVCWPSAIAPAAKFKFDAGWSRLLEHAAERVTNMHPPALRAQSKRCAARTWTSEF